MVCERSRIAKRRKKGKGGAAKKPNEETRSSESCFISDLLCVRPSPLDWDQTGRWRPRGGVMRLVTGKGGVRQVDISRPGPSEDSEQRRVRMCLRWAALSSIERPSPWQKTSVRPISRRLCLRRLQADSTADRDHSGLIVGMQLHTMRTILCQIFSPMANSKSAQLHPSPEASSSFVMGARTGELGGGRPNSDQKVLPLGLSMCIVKTLS